VRSYRGKGKVSRHVFSTFGRYLKRGEWFGDFESALLLIILTFPKLGGRFRGK